jgi:hypothetical protein
VSWGGRLDGDTRAAVALIRKGDTAESLPLNYGGIVATRRLQPREVRDLLRAARRAAGSRWLVVRSVPLGRGNPAGHIGARVAGWTGVVWTPRACEVEATFTHKCRRALNAAREAGAHHVVETDPERFLDLYRAVAGSHIYRYPDHLIRALAQEGLARFHEVELDGDRIASVLVLPGSSHWTAWLAAQDSRGREVNGNYLAVAGLMETASAAGVPAVNLGISAGMPGVALFKRRFGAVDVPVLLNEDGTPLARASRWARRGVRTASRRIRRIARRVKHSL